MYGDKNILFTQEKWSGLVSEWYGGKIFTEHISMVKVCFRMENVLNKYNNNALAQMDGTVITPSSPFNHCEPVHFHNNLEYCPF